MLCSSCSLTGVMARAKHFYQIAHADDPAEKWEWVSDQVKEHYIRVADHVIRQQENPPEK